MKERSSKSNTANYLHVLQINQQEKWEGEKGRPYKMKNESTISTSYTLLYLMMYSSCM